MAGVAVTWAITQGQGTLGNPSAVTDANGLATANFLGTDVPGGLSFTQQTITASTSFGTATFYTTTTILRLPAGGLGAPPLVERLAPAADNPFLTAAAGSTMPGAVSVRVTIQSGPQSGTPVPNVGMRMYYYDDPATTPAAACRGGLLLTDATGVATCDLIVNGNVGIGELAAIVGEAEITPPFFLTVTPGVTCSYALTLATQSFPAAGGAGSINLTTGPSCKWTAASAANWLVLTGNLSGTGNASIPFVVGPNTSTVARNATVTVATQVATISQSGATPPNNSLTITSPATLPGGTVGTPYSYALQASGGVAPYRWSVISGALPSGLSLTAAGVISGSPTANANFNFGIQVTDSANASFSVLASLNVGAATGGGGGSGPRITNAAFPAGQPGLAYSQNVTFTTTCTSPFSLPVNITVSSGSLPPGLQLVSPIANSWNISGTPTAPGSFPFTLTITETCGRSGSSAYNLVIGSGGSGGGGNPGSIQVSPAIASFSIVAGTGVKPADVVVNLKTSNNTSLAYTIQISSGATWFTITPSTPGNTPATVAISLQNYQYLQVGTYLGSYSVSAANGTIATGSVQLSVTPPANLTASPAALLFSTPVVQAPTSLTQTVTINSSTGGSAHYIAASATANNANWLGVTPGVGDTPGTLTAVVNPAGLRPGVYTGQIQASPTAGGSAATIPVTLTVTAPPTLSWSVPIVTNSYLATGPAPASIMVNLASTGVPINYQLQYPPTSWLKVDALSGSTPTNVTLYFDPAGLGPGTYQTTIVATSLTGIAPPVTLPVMFSVRLPAPSFSALFNAASQLPAPLAPGMQLLISGANLGPFTQVDAMPSQDTGRFDTTLAGTRVYFDGVAAPVLHTSDGQVTVMVPYAVAGKQGVNVVVEYRGVQSAPVSYVVTDSSPGLFTAGGSQAVAYNEDGTNNGSSGGALPGSVITVYGTGEGQTSPLGIDGLIMQGDSLATPALQVSATIGGLPADIVSAGSAPGQPAGVFRIQIRVPGGVSRGGAAPITVTIGSASTQDGVTVFIAP